jgi:tetratricopeptide (TPR) repeat protein
VLKADWLILAATLALDCLSVTGHSLKPSGQSGGGQTESNKALKFLGSYSAPSAIAATETGHVSAHPPSPPIGQRLRRIETGPTLLPPWPLDLAWTAGELSAACGGPDISNKFQLAQQTLEKHSYKLAASIYEEVARGSALCLPLSWNLALTRAYGRRPEALDELASTLPHAASPPAGQMALVLVRLASGDATISRADFDVPGSLSGETSTNTKEKDATPGEARHQPSPRMTLPTGLRERDALWARAILSWASDQLSGARECLTSLEPDAAAVWFALGGVALDEARESSRRLAESAPEGSWNRRLESEAVEFRYPDLARSILAKEAKPESSKQVKPNEKEMPTGASGSSVDDNQPELELQRLESLAESPPVLYRRVRTALLLSEFAYGRASDSPLFSTYLYAIRALAAEEESDEPAAEREYRAGLAENPESAALHAGLGHLLRQQRLLDAARDELAKAVALDPSDPVATFELGDVFQRQGDHVHASVLLSRALEIDPGLLVARWSRAKAYAALGDDREAISDLEASASADSTGELQWQLARLYRNIGRDDLAQKAQERSEQQRQQLKIK